MKKLILPIVVLMISGCTHLNVNATICNKIASDPNAIVPQECKKYDKKKADKAFNKVVNDKKVSKQDIEFSKKQEE